MIVGEEAVNTCHPVEGSKYTREFLHITGTRKKHQQYGPLDQKNKFIFPLLDAF